MAMIGTRYAELADVEDVDGLLRQIERRLPELLPAIAPDDNNVLLEAAAAALLGPGKRVRPMVTMLACAHVGGRPADALDLGCAVEMVHAASLVLDDLPCMDDAQLRRGTPTTHRAHGEDAAILAAIALLNQAYAVIIDAAAIDPATRIAILRSLTSAIGFDGLSQGQMRDLRDGPERRDEVGLTSINHQKTSGLFICGLAGGAAVGGATSSQIDALAVFGEAIGFAFQLRDDLMDATAFSSETGKDERQDTGKLTFLDLWGEERVRATILQSLARAQEAVGADCALSRYICGLLQAADLGR